MKSWSAVIWLYLTIIVTTMVLACNLSNTRYVKSAPVNKHCSSCHLYPDPGTLTSEVWVESVLPEMSTYFLWEGQSVYTYANKSFYNKLGRQPMDDDTWTEIIEYFDKYGLSEPDTLRSQELVIQTEFEEQLRSIHPTKEITALTISSTGGIKAGVQNLFVSLSAELDVIDTIDIGEDILHIYESSDDSTYVISCRTIDPHEGHDGSLWLLTDQKQQILDGLRRPVQVIKEHGDLYISEFGYRTGSLTKFDSKRKATSIHQFPGAYRILRARLGPKLDRQSLVVSIAQGMDGVYKIDEYRDNRLIPLIRFGPEFGISDIDMADINQDGLDDLLVVNGDNADYSIIPKSYHGVRVYLNRGYDKFEEMFFYPSHGATQGKFIDINSDTYMDFVVSSYFSLDSEQAVLVFLGNDQQDYRVSRVKNSNRGKWMVMNSGDIDQDGDTDIVLGSYSGGPMKFHQDSTSADLLVLFNN